MLHIPPALVLLTLLIAAPATLQAASITTSGSFGPFTHTHTYSPGDTGGGLFLADTPVSGLAKFDPALGTLDAVLFTLHTSAEYSYSLVTDGPVDLELPVAAAVSGLSAYDYTAVTWVPGVSGTTVFSAPVFPGIMPACDSFLGGCSDAPGLVTDAVDAVSADITSVVSMPDILGAGSIDPAVFTVGVAFPEALGFTLDNTGGATLDVSVAYPGGGVVELEYLFTPVPLPGAAWLLFTALSLLFGIRGRQLRDYVD